MTGKVYLVGAGPSDPGLFTLKGKKLLEQAEVVVYDALVGESVLQMIPADAEKINVGKRSSNHLMQQEDINELLADKAKEGKMVVRLKGGDPFLFGRGGEELEVLVRDGIPFEVVPGITSAISVPAYQGIPVTHRDFCSSVHIITGHRRKGQDYDIDFEALVRTKGTLIFLMGVAALPDICSNLMAAGMDKDKPAALLSHGTKGDQRRIVATVSTLASEVEKAGAITPAIIVVGDVCSLADDFSWYDKNELGGVRVLLTRPKELVSKTAEKMRDKGADVIELPAIRTERILNNQELKGALEDISSYSWLVFTSPIGVRCFFADLNEFGIDLRRIAHLKIASIGAGTAKELKERNLIPDLIPEVYDGEHLGMELAKVCTADDKVLIPRAKAGNEELIKEIEKAGTKVHDIPTYDTIYESSDLIDEKALIENGNVDYVVFTSASTVRGFAAATNGMDLSKVEAICIGKQTRAQADKLGMITYMSEKATIDSLIDKLIEVHQGR